jgi:hypothetical protein
LGGVGTKKLNINVSKREKRRRGSEDTRARGEREREREREREVNDRSTIELLYHVFLAREKMELVHERRCLELFGQ